MSLRRTGILCVVSGPSGSGKTTVCRGATQATALYYTTSCTTRAVRAGEVDGSDYFFLTEEEFQRRISAGQFLEHALVHGRRYGTLRSEVIPRLAAGEDVVMDLDPQGAAQLRACEDMAIRHSLIDVFILPAGIDELRATSPAAARKPKRNCNSACSMPSMRCSTGRSTPTPSSAAARRTTWPSSYPS